jgi:hypothetical protein
MTQRHQGRAFAAREGRRQCAARPRRAGQRPGRQLCARQQVPAAAHLQPVPQRARDAALPQAPGEPRPQPCAQHDRAGQLHHEAERDVRDGAHHLARAGQPCTPSARPTRRRATPPCSRRARAPPRARAPVWGGSALLCLLGRQRALVSVERRALCLWKGAPCATVERPRRPPRRARALLGSATCEQTRARQGRAAEPQRGRPRRTCRRSWPRSPASTRCRCSPTAARAASTRA